MTDLYPARLPNREQRTQMILLRAESQRAHLAACQAEDRGVGRPRRTDADPVLLGRRHDPDRRGERPTPRARELTSHGSAPAAMVGAPPRAIRTTRTNDERETTMSTTEVRSTYQHRPAYRYIRAADRLPTNDANVDSLAPVRLFNPTGIGTWWIASYNPDEQTAWGVADIHEREAGAIWIPELVEFRGRFNLPIERDLHYRPVTVAEILAGGGA